MALLTLLLLVLEICVAVKSEVELQKRIIGGRDCDSERPYHVALYEDNYSNPVCGGSLIKGHWVLTAAHCWINGGVHKAVVGVNFPRKNAEKPMTIKEVPKFYIDQNDGLQHDIMLLKLPEEATVTPVKLPTDCSNPIKVGVTVQIAGVGATTAGPNGTKISDTSEKPLQCADFQVQNIDQLTYFGHQFFVKGTKKDVCDGDSGEGAIHNNMIYGVHSASHKTVCTDSAYEMDVCKYEEWISKTIDPNCHSFTCLG